MGRVREATVGSGTSNADLSLTSPSHSIREDAGWDGGDLVGTPGDGRNPGEMGRGCLKWESGIVGGPSRRVLSGDRRTRPME